MRLITYYYLYLDCGDNSDEGTHCPTCPFASCSHICVVKKLPHKESNLHNKSHNFTCECAPNYTMVINSSSKSYCKAKGKQLSDKYIRCSSEIETTFTLWNEFIILFLFHVLFLDEQPYMLVATLGGENDLRKTNPHKPYDNETTTILPTGYNNIECMDYIMDQDGSVTIFWSTGGTGKI